MFDSSFIFFREDNDFSEFLSDTVLKSHIRTKIKLQNYLIVEFDYSLKEEHQSYLYIKYGEDLRDSDSLFKDRKPVIFKDYQPQGLEGKRVLNK